MKKTCAATGGILGLVLLFSACEKEGMEADLGGKVALTVSLNSGDYVEAGARGFQMKMDETALEEVVVPLGEDENYYLMATLRPDPEQENELRGAPSNGQRIALAAYDNSTDALAAGPVNYYYSTAAHDLIPVTAGSPLVVDVNKTYYIAAYSYNSTSVNPGTSGIDPSVDLLWGKSDPKYITLSDRTVEINMDHLFSQVMVNISVANVSSSATISTIGTVKIEGRRQAGLEPGTGDLVPGSAVAALDVTSTLTGSGATQESDYYLFYPSPTKVTISSITISGVANPLTNLEALFTKTLEPGKKYILAVDIAKVGWATSNIYWNGTKLTFDKYLVGSHPNYQGVFFKHGSLVGISPGGPYDNPDYSSLILYVPPVRGESAWATTTASASNAWGSTFASIPYLNGTYNLPTSGNYLHDQINDPDAHYYNYYGDICSYLTDGTWRMPNIDEFGVSANYTGMQISGTFQNDATGKGVVSHGLTYNTGSETVLFPYSGHRSNSGSFIVTGGESRGRYPFYLSGSGRADGGVKYVHGLIYSTSVINPGGSVNVDWASSIRCIKN